MDPYNPFLLHQQMVTMMQAVDSVRMMIVGFRDGLQNEGFTKTQANALTMQVFAGTPDLAKEALKDGRRKKAADGA